MDKIETTQKLNGIISKYLKIPVADLNDDVSYDEEPAWDSVTHLKMISEIEETFKVVFDVDEIVLLENVGKIRESVLKKLE